MLYAELQDCLSFGIRCGNLKSVEILKGTVGLLRHTKAGIQAQVLILKQYMYH